MKIPAALAVVALSLAPLAVLATTTTNWTGATDNQVNLAGNYDNGQPSNSNLGVIGGGANNQTVYTGANKLNSKTLTFNASAALSGANVDWKDGHITLNGSSQWNATGAIVMGVDTGDCSLQINDHATLIAPTLTVGVVSFKTGTVTQSGGAVTLNDLAIPNGTYDFTRVSKGTLTVATNGSAFAAAGGFTGLIQAGKITWGRTTVPTSTFIIDNSVSGYSTLSVKLLYSVYDRPLHITWALSGGPALGGGIDGDNAVLDAIDQVVGGVTMVTPFALNADPDTFSPNDFDRYETMLAAMKDRGIAVFLGIGKEPGTQDWGINSANMHDLALRLLHYSDSIRVENVQGFYDLQGPQPVQNFITFLGDNGFKHIMLNPWPKDSSGALAALTGAESTMIQVTLDNDPQTGVVHNDPSNWKANQTKIDLVTARNMLTGYNPDIKVLVNYESAPQHLSLAWLEGQQAHSSEDAMDIAATQSETCIEGWSWAPPWTHIYDPLDFGTWSWIKTRLGQMNTQTTPGPACAPAPVGGATNVSRTRQLSWRAGSWSATSDVYFGTNANPPFVGNQAATTFNPGTLQANTTYYWKITDVNQYGKTAGPVWSFTTGP